MKVLLYMAAAIALSQQWIGVGGCGWPSLNSNSQRMWHSFALRKRSPSSASMATNLKRCRGCRLHCWGKWGGWVWVAILQNSAQLLNFEKCHLGTMHLNGCWGPCWMHGTWWWHHDFFGLIFLAWLLMCLMPWLPFCQRLWNSMICYQWFVAPFCPYLSSCGDVSCHMFFCSSFPYLLVGGEYVECWNFLGI